MRRRFAPLLLLAACGGRAGLISDGGAMPDEPSSGGGKPSLEGGAASRGWVDAATDTEVSASADATAPGNPLAPTIASSYLINASHTSFAAGSSLRAPLARVWTANLPGVASYPLIAGGLVFVIAAAPSPQLVALSARTGQTVWSATLPGGFAAHAYDGGRVFTVDGSGTATAFDAATGAKLWSASMRGTDITDWSTVPTAYGGVLYTSAAGTGGTLFAYDEPTGKLLFQNYSPYNGDQSPPAVDAQHMIVAYACQQTYAYDPMRGASQWHYATSCGGGGADVPVLHGGEVYVTDPMQSVTLDESMGTSIGTFAARQPPAFDGTMGVFVNGGQLTAVNSSGLTAWTYAGDNGVTFQAPVLLTAGYVYTVDNSSLRAFDETTGVEVWSDAAMFGSANIGSAPTALGAADGLLVVPEGDRVVSYASAADAGAGTSAGGGGDGGCRWTLQPGLQLTTGDEPVSVAVADFNRDGALDLAVAAFNGTYDTVPYSVGLVSVLLGNGDGTYRMHVDYTTAQGTSAVASADLNGDGVPDLAVVNEGGGPPAETGEAPGSVSILLGRGDGTFAPQVQYDTVLGSQALAIGDLNGDGVPDIAVANDAETSLMVLLGNGDGTFQSATPIANPPRTVAIAVAVGDLNGDGRPDIVTVDEGTSVDIFLNAGGGTFQTPVAYPSFQESGRLTEPNSVAIGDVDGDGKLDLAVTNVGDSNVSVFLGNGDGTFQAQTPYATNDGPQDGILADVNRDGRLDILLTEQSTPDVSVLLGNGDGTFQPQVFFAVSTQAQAIATGDFNGDGLPDVAATDGLDEVEILFGACTP